MITRTVEMLALVALLLALAPGATPAPTPAPAQNAHDLFQRALVIERVDGQLEAAIGLYERIVEDSRAERSLVAEALLRMGGCYEKLGQAGALLAYERLLRDYADQAEVAATARARLAELRGAGGGQMVARRVWPDAQPGVGAFSDVSNDGRYLSYIDSESGANVVAVRDLEAGTSRALAPVPGYSKTLLSPDSERIAYLWWDPAGGVEELRVASVDGTGPRALYRSPLASAWPMDWSADGDSMLAMLNRHDHVLQIALLSVADGSATVLKSLGWRLPLSLRMSLSPDGRWIAYSFPPDVQSPNGDIYLLATDGSRETVLVEHPAHDVVIGWSPG